MTFLPIVQRELRVAARKRATFWLRVGAAFVAVVIGSALMLFSRLGALPSASLGSALFSALTWLSLVGVLAAGLFFTSDCLSEEKREGTLGFLFLTDLRGYDVVLGKMLATSLRCFFALLAVFPILAVTLLMGGVTGAQFWSTLVALCNALFCSLAAGVCVSAVSRDAQKAMRATMWVMLAWLAAGPIADGAWAQMHGPGLPFPLSLSSPGYLFKVAAGGGHSTFWLGLGLTQFLAWLLFALACWLAPRTWQDKASRPSPSPGTRTYAWKYGGPSRRAALRQRLLGGNPVLWLVCRERWQSFGVWTFALLLAGAFFVLLAFRASAEVWTVWTFAGGVFTLMLYLWTASQAGRFVVEARRSGFTELLLASPVTVRQIVDGQWQGLLRLVALPVLLVLGMQVVGTLLSQQATWGRVTVRMTASAPAVAAMAGTAVASALTTAANLAALSWYGIWNGLTSKNNNLATLKTLAWVQLVPWFVVTFASTLLTTLVLMPFLFKAGAMSGGAAAGAFMTSWFPLLSGLLATLLYLGKDVAFIVWARRRLYSSFRERVAGGFAPRFMPPSVPLPPSVPAPPVIPAQP